MVRRCTTVSYTCQAKARALHQEMNFIPSNTFSIGIISISLLSKQGGCFISFISKMVDSLKPIQENLKSQVPA